MNADDVKKALVVLAGPVTAWIVSALFTGHDPIECDTRFYPARIMGGARSPERLKWIVLHSTESLGTAANVASYFQSDSAGGSTQVVVGDDGCFRCVDDLRIPAGAPGANEEGLHIEFNGLAKWTRDEWLAHDRELALGAVILGQWSREYGIPLVYIGVDGLLAGDRGVVTHYDVSRAFHKSDHQDPGEGFPVDDLIDAARLTT